MNIAAIDDRFELAPNEARQVDVLLCELGARLREVVHEDLAQGTVLGSARIVVHEAARARDRRAWPMSKVGRLLRCCFHSHWRYRERSLPALRVKVHTRSNWIVCLAQVIWELMQPHRFEAQLQQWV